jgi:hypothetical protein
VKSNLYIKTLFTIIFSLCIFSKSHAEVTTYLQVDCGSWIERKDTKKVQYEAYVIGLLTGMNSMWSNTTQYQQNKKKYKEDVFDGITNPNQFFLSI